MPVQIDLPSRERLTRTVSRETCHSLWRRLSRGRPADRDDSLDQALAQPLGAISRELACADAGIRHWARLSPVTLVADMNGVGLVGLPEPDPQETEELLAIVAEACVGPGLQVDPDPQGGLWLSSRNALALQSVPPEQALGNDIHAFQPVGEGARAWRTCAGEIEIGLHHAALNRRRSECGQPAISGVWIWGCGALPDRPEPGSSILFSEGRWQRTAARWAGWSVSGLDAPAGVNSGKKTLVDLRSCLEPPRVEAWLAAVPGWLGGRLVVALEDEPAVRISRWDGLAFWRRSGTRS